jgi:dolichol kinase
MLVYLVLSISAVVGFNLVLFAILRKTSALFSKLHLRRRVQHSVTGLVILVVYSYLEDSRMAGIIALLSSVFFMAFDLYRRKINLQFNESFIRNFGWILRTHEYYDRPLGATFFLFGVAVVTTLSKVQSVVYLSILNLSFCDPIASMVGSVVKSPQISANKTVAGTLSAGLAGVLVAVVYTLVSGEHVDLWAALLIALVSEVCKIPGVDDNLTIPSISCVLWKLYIQDIQ